MKQQISDPWEHWLHNGDPNPAFDPRAASPPEIMGECRSRREYVQPVPRGIKHTGGTLLIQ